MTTTIQQLEDLKEWSQNSARYERRLNFRGAGLVQPGPGRQGYADKRKSPTKINEDLFKQIDDLIADAGKAGKVLDKKALGEGLGYKVVEKGKTAGQGGLNKVIEAWEESRDTVFEYKPSKLTLDSPQVKEVLKLQEEGMSTRQITKKLGYTDEKAVRNIFRQFRPDAIKEPNVPGEITSAKQSKKNARTPSRSMPHWQTSDPTWTISIYP